MEDAGRLRDSAQLQLKTLKKIIADDLPTKLPAQWKKLHDLLNHEVNLRALNKDAVDSDDELTLEAMGIL